MICAAKTCEELQIRGKICWQKKEEKAPGKAIHDKHTSHLNSPGAQCCAAPWQSRGREVNLTGAGSECEPVLPSTAKGVFFLFLPHCPVSLLLSALPASWFDSSSCTCPQVPVFRACCWEWLWDGHLVGSCSASLFVPEESQAAHHISSQTFYWQPEADPHRDYCLSLESAEKGDKTFLENFVSTFRWLILFFLCISHFVCPDCSSPASHHSTWCKFNPSSHSLGTLQTRTSSSRS